MLLRKSVLLIVTILVTTGGLALTGCAMPTSSPPGDPVPTFVPGEITIIDAHSRPAMAGGTGVIYLTIQNGTDEAVRLVSAETNAAAAVEMHETIDDNGVMRMQPRPEGFDVPAGGSIALEPGGKHIMLIDLQNELEPETQYPVTLHFDTPQADNGISREVQVTVQPTAGMEHGSMGDEPASASE